MTDTIERRPVAGLPVSVLVPVRDFGPGWDRFLESWRQQLGQLFSDYELIVIDDRSTEPIAEQADVLLLRHDWARGLGASLRDGLAASRYPLVLFLIPEYSYRPSDLRTIIEALADADIVAPFRRGAPRPTLWDRLGKLGRFISKYVFGIELSPPAAWYGWGRWRNRLRLRWIYGLRMQDPTCGLRLFRRDVLERCPIQSDGAFALVELFAKASFCSALVAEVPLGKPGDLPVMRGRFEEIADDQKRVFKSPTFGKPSFAATH